MKKILVYIDHAGDDDAAFASELKEKLKSIKDDFDVKTFKDINIREDDWERDTTIAIKKADIIIPILSSTYLSFITNSIESTFDNIIDSEDRYLFPILFSQCEWGSVSWIVRSSITPSDDQPLADFTLRDKNKIVNGLIKTIRNIIAKHNLSQVNYIEKKVSSIKNNDKVVFISHDHDDADFAELLKMKLEKSGLSGWIDSERLKIGQDWREEIDQGIETSVAVIAVMTPNARKSEYVTYEWAFAWGKGIKIFPIMLKQTQLHPRLELIW